MNVWISESGKLIFFGKAGSPVTAIAGKPTVYLDGKPVALGDPVWFPKAKTVPFVAYQLRCGTVETVAIRSGGVNVVAPQVTSSGRAAFYPPVTKPGSIVGIPVAQGGDRAYEPPSLRVTDPGNPDSGAVVVPVMSGAARGDVFTYDAPDGWLTMTTGPAKGATGGTVDNWAGGTEGASGGFKTFAQPPTLVAGMNVAAQPTYPSRPGFTAKNRMKQADNWARSGNTYTRWIYGPSISNLLDNSGVHNATGIYTVKYDDPDANTAMGSAVKLYCDAGKGGAAAFAWPVNLSGPNVGTSTPAVVDPADIKFPATGGPITSVNLASSNLGTDYQGVTIMVSGGGGTGCLMGGTVDPATGTVSSIYVIQPGSGYRTPPTIGVYGTRLGGQTVTSNWNIQYTRPDPPSWVLGVSMSVARPPVADEPAKRVITDPWVVLPKPDGTAAADFDRSDPLATDDNVIATLSVPTANDAIFTRDMDGTQGFGGLSNYQTEEELPDPMADSWQTPHNITATFRYARRFNTDPNSTVYPWSSTKVYGLQALFKGVGHDDFGDFVPIRPKDDGYFVLPNYGSQNWGIVELRSEEPHGITTGRWVVIGGNGRIPLTYFGQFRPPIQGRCYVTGPNTIVMSRYLGTVANAPASIRAQQIDSAEEIDLTTTGGAWTATVSVPSGPRVIPYRYSARRAAEIGAKRMWVNLPYFATPGLYQKIGAETAAGYGDSGGLVYVEHSNELWNGTFGDFVNLWSLQVLMAFIPAGTKVLDRWAATGQQPGYDAYGPAILLSAHAHDEFVKGWVAAGQDPARIRRVMGSQFQGPGRTQQIVAAMTAWDVPVDAIAVAPYIIVPNNAPVVAACSPIGSSVAAAQGWPIDAVNDFVRHYTAYNTSDIAFWAAHMAAIKKAPRPVELVCYEGAIQTGIPNGTPSQAELQHDQMLHPSARSLIKGFLATAQAGGATMMAYFAGFDPPAYPTTWSLAWGATQQPGDGRGNRFATPQGGWPGDGRDHNGGPNANVSPMLLGLREWVAAAAAPASAKQPMAPPK